MIPGRCSARRRLVVGEVDQLFSAEARMQGEVHQARQSLRLNLRHARDRIRIEHAVAHDAQAARGAR